MVFSQGGGKKGERREKDVGQWRMPFEKKDGKRNQWESW